MRKYSSELKAKYLYATMPFDVEPDGYMVISN